MFQVFTVEILVLWTQENQICQMAVSSLNPMAPVFYSQKTPYILMPPMQGLCSAFQFGTCHHTSHHNSEDGHMAIHACQACLIFRQIFVDHTCKGGHPNHTSLCGIKKFGAVACPHHLVNSQVHGKPNASEYESQVTQPIPNGFIQQFEDGIKIPHMQLLCRFFRRISMGT